MLGNYEPTCIVTIQMEDLHRVACLSVSDPFLIGCEKSRDKLLGYLSCGNRYEDDLKIEYFF